MHYTVKYTGSKEQRRIKAFGDAMEYLGSTDLQCKVLKIVQDIFKDDSLTGRQKIRTCKLAMSFVGLVGAPCWAIMHTIHKCS